METGFGMGGLGMGLGLLFWIFLFLAFYYVLVEKNKTGKIEATPIETLKHRYAAGEITREEYLEMRREI